MELRRGRGGEKGVVVLKVVVPRVVCIFLCLLCVCAVMASIGYVNGPLDIRDPAARASGRRRDSFFQGRGRGRVTALGTARRHLSGPGSYPPRCMSKCGRCTPCKPVHVPVPPGTPVTTEYYPEAWRCKCGNRLYMP